MKKTAIMAVCALLLTTVLAACSPSLAPSASPLPSEMLNVPSDVPKAKGEVIPTTDIDEYGGADTYDNTGDNAQSRYYVNMDFYNAKNDDMLTILERYKTYQQTAEWSCGNVTALTALHYLGVDTYTEWSIAEAMGSHTDLDTPGAGPGTADNFFEYGTDVRQMTEFFESVPGLVVLETSYRADYSDDELLSEADGVSESYFGNLPHSFSAMSLYTSDNDPESENYIEDAANSYFVKWLVGHLQAGHVIMTEWCDWDGHWTAIVGYDTNGTPGLGDDILIFADPYDTSDHWQDGYAIYPLERWFYIWNDRTVAAKPYQVQPYLVVGKE